MRKPESFLEQEMQQIPWGSEMQTEQLITIRKPDQEIIN